MTEAVHQMTDKTMKAGVTRRGQDVFVTDTSIALSIEDRQVFATISGNMTITLPPVSLARGMFVHIWTVARTGGAITVQDYLGDDPDFAHITLNAAAERCLLLSTGVHWLDLDCSCAQDRGRMV